MWIFPTVSFSQDKPKSRYSRNPPFPEKNISHTFAESRDENYNTFQVYLKPII